MFILCPILAPLPLPHHGDGEGVLSCIQLLTNLPVIRPQSNGPAETIVPSSRHLRYPLPLIPQFPRSHQLRTPGSDLELAQDRLRGGEPHQIRDRGRGRESRITRGGGEGGLCEWVEFVLVDGGERRGSFEAAQGFGDAEERGGNGIDRLQDMGFQ